MLVVVSVKGLDEHPCGRPVLALPSSLVSGLWHNQRVRDYCALSTILGLGDSADLASGAVFPNVREA